MLSDSIVWPKVWLTILQGTPNNLIQWNPSIATTSWAMKFCPLYRGGLISGVDLYFKNTSEVAFIEGCPHIRGGLYRGVSSRQGWPL